MTNAQRKSFDAQDALDENRKKLSVILLIPVEKRSTQQTADQTALQKGTPQAVGRCDGDAGSNDCRTGNRNSGH